MIYFVYETISKLSDIKVIRSNIIKSKPFLILLRKGFRDTNNLIIDIFLKQKRNLKNTVVS